jgi:hypothetical protein
MIKLELFQMYHLRNVSFSGTLLSCSILQLTFLCCWYSLPAKAWFVILSQQIYHIGALVGLAALLLINEVLLVNNSLSSNNFIINDYFSFVTKLVICLTSVLFLLIVKFLTKMNVFKMFRIYVILVTISVWVYFFIMFF